MSIQANKLLTFSFDDAVTQDRRLVDLFGRYGLKCTFNLNSLCLSKTGEIVKGGRTVTHDKIAPGELAELYRGHEVAGHTQTHPHLEALGDEDVVRETEEDRLALGALCGYEVIGFAYPYGTYDDRVVRLMRERTGIRYARTVSATYGFDMPADPMRLDPSVHAMEFDRLFELGEAFIRLRTDEKKLFYVWGHSYEFDFDDTWSRFEDFCKMMAGRDDIAYVTNREALGM